jgi:alanine-synthesizing transaminase
MFSSRTQWNMLPNSLSRLVAAKRLRGETFLDLTESNPTRCGFSYPEKEILGALAQPSSFIYQPDPRGLPLTRKAIAHYYESLGVVVSPENIILTASTSEAYSFLFKLLCNAGEEIVVPQPSYPLLEYLCQLNDVALRHYHLVYDGEWHIDFETLQSAMTKHTRAIVLVHPNNPTGSYIKQNEFERVCAIAAEHYCAVIVDEVFQPYSLFPDVHRANILTTRSSSLVFSLNGISKLLGLPQLKLSWIAVSGQPQQIGESLDRLDIIADTFLSVNTPVQAALPQLLSSVSHIESQILKRIQRNSAALQKSFMNSRTSVFHVEGGWYAILRLPQIFSDDQWAEKFLFYENIIVQPGHYYGMEQPSCIVLSLLPPVDQVAVAIKTMCKFIEENSSSSQG